MLREKFVKDDEHWKLFMQSKEITCDSSFLQAIEKGVLNYMYLLSTDYYLLDSLKYNKLSSLGLAVSTMDMTLQILGKFSFLEHRQVILNVVFVIHSSYFGTQFLCFQGYCNLSNNAKSSLTGVANATSLNNVIIPSDILRQDAQLNLAKCEEGALNTNPSDGRVMLIDGTSIIYRAYYKLLGML